jgi:hypothetical protein
VIFNAQTIQGNYQKYVSIDHWWIRCGQGIFWMRRCRVSRKDACGCLPVKTAVRLILLAKKTPLDRTEFNGWINGTLF